LSYHDDREISRCCIFHYVPLISPPQSLWSRLVDDIGWITKIHSESISRKKLSKILFSTKMCQEIEYCPKLETKKIVEEEVDAPYW
jgi:hypothetical protein